MKKVMRVTPTFYVEGEDIRVYEIEGVEGDDPATRYVFTRPDGSYTDLRRWAVAPGAEPSKLIDYRAQVAGETREQADRLLLASSEYELATTPPPKSRAVGEARDGRRRVPRKFEVSMDMSRLVRGMDVPSPWDALPTAHSIGLVLRAFQELAQNASDGAIEAGAAGQWTFARVDARKGAPVVIENPGVLELADIGLMGSSSKKDPRFVGKYGDGFKLAMAALHQAARAAGWPDIEIKIYAGAAVITPSVVESAIFEGRSVLAVSWRDGSDPAVASRTRIEIRGVPDAAWQAWRVRCLNGYAFSTPPTSLGGCRILWGAEHRGLLFLRGVYVGPLDKDENGMPEVAAAGYDIDGGVDLDYDRRMADVSSARGRIVELWKTGVDCGVVSVEQLAGMLAAPTFEAQAFYNAYEWRSWADALSTRLAADFVRQWGEDAVPVSDDGVGRSQRAEALGLKCIPVSRAMRALLEAKLGKFEARVARSETGVAETYAPESLTAGEAAELAWACGLVEGAGVPCGDVSIVRFRKADQLGEFSVEGGAESIRLSRAILSRTDGRTLTTLIHELAHRVSDSHDAAHAREMERIFALVVLTLSKNPASTVVPAAS